MRAGRSWATLLAMGTVFTVVATIVVVAVLAVAAWAFVVAPLVLPHRHLRH